MRVIVSLLYYILHYCSERASTSCGLTSVTFTFASRISPIFRNAAKIASRKLNQRRLWSVECAETRGKRTDSRDPASLRTKVRNNDDLQFRDGNENAGWLTSLAAERTTDSRSLITRSDAPLTRSFVLQCGYLDSRGHRV